MHNTVPSNFRQRLAIFPLISYRKSRNFPSRALYPTIGPSNIGPFCGIASINGFELFCKISLILTFLAISEQFFFAQKKIHCRCTFLYSPHLQVYLLIFRIAKDFSSIFKQIIRNFLLHKTLKISISLQNGSSNFRDFEMNGPVRHQSGLHMLEGIKMPVFFLVYFWST